MSHISFTLHKNGGTSALELDYQNLFIIGYAGRNMEKTLEHIRELERDLGVPAPKKIPTIFQCSNMLLTQEAAVHFVGEKTCGEVEYIIIKKGDHIYIGIGSDHTDRELEAASVPKAKQVCPKPIGVDVWDYADVKAHWDSIRVESYQTVDNQEVMYQRGTLADILPPEKILSELSERLGDIGDCVIYSGTVPVLNGFKYGTNFRCELTDDTLSRKLTLGYDVLIIFEEER